MNVRGWSAGLLSLVLLATNEVAGQPPTTAKVEAIPLELKSPDRYQTLSILEPIRRVTVTAPVDGILRTMDLPVGASVQSQQEIGQLDRSEAAARVRIAKANLKEVEASLKGAANTAVVQAQIEAARARAELAELELEHYTFRAPFAGRLLEVDVSPGQFLAKGTKVADLADVSSLRVLVPFERSAVSLGATVNVSVEGQIVAGKVVATLPLPETLSPLRELATAYTAAWLVLPNLKGEIEPGQRVLSPSLPTAPIATIPSRAVHEPPKGQSAGPRIQVIRNEYVTDLPVRILGHPGPERTQISGLLRPNDALIVSSSVPLLAGTLIRFSGSNTGGGIEGTNPNPAEGGELAGITPPRAGTRTYSDTGTAGGRLNGRSSTPSRTTTTRPGTSKSAAPPF